MQVRSVYDAIRSVGGEVLVVAAARPESLVSFAARQRHPFPIVADPERAGYGAFGLGRFGLSAMTRPGLFVTMFGLLARGWIPRLPRAEDDVSQIGGDFVLDAARRLVWQHAMTSPDDRPTPSELLTAVRRAAAQPLADTAANSA